MTEPDAQYISQMHLVQATVIAKVVRDALEEIHGGGIEDEENGLSDAQMAKINPLVRNAVLTALTNWDLVKRGSQAAVNVFNYTYSSVPDYWETPELLEDYVETVEGPRFNAGPVMPAMARPYVTLDRATCKNCDQPIYRLRGVFSLLFTGVPEDKDPWKHRDAPWWSRGCRSASYNSESGTTDDSLPKTANATPPRGWKSSS